MDVRFYNVISRFFPKGKAWELTGNFDNLVKGLSVEFGRAYNQIKTINSQIEITKSSALAIEHGRDYIIDTELFDADEIQRIIVNYINKEVEFKDVISDFADYIGYPVVWFSDIDEIEFTFEFTAVFGDESTALPMILKVEFDPNIQCKQYNQLIFLIEYLKPPYIQIEYIGVPNLGLTPFEIGLSEVGSPLGDTNPC